VGSFPAGRGPFGHLDLAGNAWEWCRDVWEKQVYAKRAGSEQEIVDPVVTGSSAERCLRGGAFYGDAQYLRSAYRYRSRAELWFQLVGFRVAVFPASVAA
jgi:formylglycine-generating enzyme required for sulfatase activity